MKRNTQLTELICPVCGFITPIQRKNGKLKKLYHIKKLYCLSCKEVVNQIEVRDSSLLKKQLEFKHHLNENEEKVLTLLYRFESK